MMLISIGLALLVLVATVLFLRKPSPRAATSAVRPTRPVERTQAQAAAVPRPPSDVTLPHVPFASAAPALLADFRLIRGDEIADDLRRQLVATFKEIPRPPKLLYRLLSPDFVNEASSAQLVDLIAGEPQIAAKLLSAINSPMVGLKAPVGSIGQAVTYLGLNTVRSLCLQYILIASFKSDGEDRKRMLDATWRAGALASELTQRVAQRLEFAERGAMVSSVVLSFLGRLGTTASMAREQLSKIVPHGLLERTISEQHTLGLSSSQVGRLLMDDWALPAAIVADAAGIDDLLFTPAAAFGADRAARLAVCYLCARLGERLAEGTLIDLYSVDPLAGADPEFFHLRGYLASPKLARLVQVVQSPEIGDGIAPMLASMRR